ncbi:C4-dicarboxylate TRAP transporter substrate-binding protein [Vreelandella zhaodongensis]|uniref:TRAP transporter substrate-binding protein DctP n=1 Tax=Vreelandella zhaodongensis TaxID=1176240 RepID=A0ABX2SMI9_VREZH|nr:C4-dicarboxylate TRAP transporter substrate-binding protein [Halomonas zhaodongensis]NYS43470.1 TRAP transporter substrate-binding protein DctP [Halomonas zhaodongensis]
MRLNQLSIAITLATVTSIGFATASHASTVIRVAYGNQPGEPVDVAVNQWAEWVSEASNGELELKAFPASQLGSETDVLEQARFGSAIISITAYSNFLDSVPDLSVLDAPYLSEDFDAKLKVFDSDWFADQVAQVESAGYHIVIPNAVYGVRHLLTRQPVSSPDDLDGVGVRVQNSQMYVAAIRAMGATPTPMSLGDVYPALAQGMVDGVENPAAVLYGGKFHEVVKHLSLTAHMHTVAPFVTGQAFWNQLDEAQQQILTETGQQMADYLAKLVAEDSEQALDKLRSEGVEIHEVDTTPFRERAAEQIPSAFPQWSDGLYETVYEIING